MISFIMGFVIGFVLGCLIAVVGYRVIHKNRELLCGYDKGCGRRLNGHCDLSNPKECPNYVKLKK
jgi:hypothetical protein